MTLKRVLIVLIAVMVVGSITFAQGRGQGRGWGQGARGVCVNWSVTPVMVEGNIVKVETVDSTRGRFEKGIHLVVKTKTGNKTVHVGPEAWVVKNGLSFKKGNTVKFKAYEGTYNNAPAFIAAEVTNSGKVIALRDNIGRPMWSRSLDPNQRLYKNRRQGRGRGWNRGRRCGPGRGWANNARSNS